MSEVSVDEITRQLYGLPPGEFTASRNARAKEAAAQGDKERAGVLRALPKPTAAAWLANTLVRDRASTVRDLVHLGPELRHAQGNGLRADMRRVMDRRRALITDLVRAASDAADDAGQPFGTQVERQLEETLEAAVADDTMAAALLAGQLSEPLRFVGFGGSTQAPAPRARATVTAAATGVVATGAPAASAAQVERARRRADAARQSARDALLAAQATAEAAQKRLESAVARHRSAEKEQGAADRERKAATGALERAQRELVEAKRTMDKTN
jgi:hypothetical protein